MKKYIKKESSQSIAFDRCCLNGKNNDLAVQGEAYFSFKNMKNIISYNIEKSLSNFFFHINYSI